ncbi:MAG: SAM-dependent methyltransferase [Verrucomicrobiota bacterium]
MLGYIFEKYINQKQMGAYYTKEDITEYISKNTVLPFLFDAARAKCKVAFGGENGTGDSPVWDLLRENPDRYIYAALRHGADHKLPPEIAAGLDATTPNLIERRKAWNTPAPAEFALPTEIWREAVARRQRYEEVRKKLAAGEVREINDFITLNLDLRQFAQDVIQNCEGPDLLLAFWQAITTITVLDPTGGSGAFIFAALNILEPLYEACLDRMEAFLAEWGENGKKAHPNYHKKFTEVLARVDAHPNRRYFVLKSIILNNLYAVDIMEEAVEICKLRLFLKLAAQVEPDTGRDNLGIEPLPDIDFNIRAGNTLVGYATKEEVQRCMKEVGGGQMKLLDEADLGSFARFNTRCADVEQAFTKFRQLQTEGDGSVPYADKQELQKRLKALEDELNRHLATDYGVKVSDKTAYAKWLKSHQPFHWFVQFYGILARGGFDVLVGNPPYVEMSKVSEYRVTNYKTLDSGNLYALCLERSSVLLCGAGHMGVIVPLSGFSTERMSSYQDFVWNRFNSLALSYYSGDAHPSVLFDGVKYRLCIIVATKTKSGDRKVRASDYIRWYADERQALFATKVIHAPTRYSTGFLRFAKTGTRLAEQVLSKLVGNRPSLATYLRRSGKGHITYHRSPVFWIRSMDFEPFFKSPVKDRSTDHLKDLYFQDTTLAQKAGAFLNSSLFYFWFTVQGNCRNIAGPDIESFPVGDLEDPRLKNVAKVFSELMADLKRHSKRRVYVYEEAGRVEYDEFYPDQSKPILDEIDTVLAAHYGFTTEELDFILNYDIKYRLGRDTESEEE